MNEDERSDQKPFSFGALSLAATDGGLTRSERRPSKEQKP
jgi:hypothetical protein